MAHPFKIKGDVYNYNDSQLLTNCTTEELLLEYDRCQEMLTKEKWNSFKKSLPLWDIVLFFVSLWFIFHGEREFSPIGLGISIGFGISIFSQKWAANQEEPQRLRDILKEIRLILRDRDIRIK